jgi:tryptophan-rich sensory protein
MTWTIAIAIVITLAVLGVGGATTDIGVWYRDLRKPRWTPPNWVFGPAWTIILGLTAWAGVIGWSRATTAEVHVRLGVAFGLNILLYILWSPLFFNLKRPDWALIEVPFLGVSILALILILAPLSSLAAWLLSPYLLWVAFAAFLNLAIVRLNPPPGPDVGSARSG